MKFLKQLIALAIISIFMVAPLAGQRKDEQVPARRDSDLAAKIRRFAPTVLTASTSQLSVKDRQALREIIAAAKYYDALYRRQLWSGNEAVLKRLQADTTPLGLLLQHSFLINQCPWSQL